MDKKRIGLYAILYEYLLVLRKPFADFLLKHMKNICNDEWWNICVLPFIKEPYKNNIDDLDIFDLLNILLNKWNELYSSIRNIKGVVFIYDENFRVIKDMIYLRNIVSHANENNVFVSDMHKQLSTILKFAIFIGAYEYIIINLKNDLKKYKKEKNSNDDKKREELLDIINSEVLFSAMICTNLSTETKTSVLRSIIAIQNMKTADEIYDFYTGALQSSKGQWVYKSLREQNLTTFEDIRDKINAIMNR